MTRTLTATTAVAAVLALSTDTAQAQQEPTVEQLQQKLEQRDKVIMELLERVERLERRVGVDGTRETIKRAEQASESQQEANSQPKPDTEAEQTTSSSAPGKVVVEEGEAERALERSLTSEGALLLRAGRMEVEPSLTYTRDTDNTPSLATVGGNTAAVRLERNSDSLTVDLAIRLGLPFDSQLEFGVPYRWRSVEQVTSVGFSPVATSSDSASAVGDFRIGVAKTLLREGLWQPDLIGRITWDTASGDDAENGVSLGGGYDEVRGSLTAVKRQDPIAFVTGLSYQHVFENNDVQPGASYTTSLSGVVALSPETSVSLGVSGGYQEEFEIDGQEREGSDSVLGRLNLGASTLLAPGVLFNVSTGIGLTEDSDDFSVTFSVPIQFDAF
ncbi:transporter [Thiohalophilus sp.]|uniref:transporter n=1 Tax=Thiohalophilus sp. TaxID=3028392 RepID=UPI002ACD964B|nr:transporter [Thiohalophilus sp.]MDZ7662954.1 transporter [Thiohalophilus sp.]